MRLCVCAEQPVHVADAGVGFPAVCPASRGDFSQATLTHHPSHPAAGHTGPAGGKCMGYVELMHLLIQCWLIGALFKD